MASASKRPRSEQQRFSPQEVVVFIMNDESDEESSVDSEVGGISSGEEFELNQGLEGESAGENDSDSVSVMSLGNGDITHEESSDEGAPEILAANPRPARGRGARGRQARRVGPVQNRHTGHGSYDDPDHPNQLPGFSPRRPAGIHLETPVLSGTMTRALDFFQLFFSAHILQDICTHTNAYAWRVIEEKPSYADKSGTWTDTSPGEIKKMIALILYCGLVDVSSFHRYWSTKTLYHGLWARSIMSRERFKALMAMLHVVDPSAAEDGDDKLRKFRTFLDHFKERCQALYQPFQNVAVEERMVKSELRSGISQYIKNKPTKWGLKIWVLTDSSNGYTCDFDVYTGRDAGRQPSVHGLAYDVVMALVQPLVNQGYHLYFDHFYTSVQLVKDLFRLDIPSTGTTAENRRGFPDGMKDGKKWAKKTERGSMRWERDGECLALQWKDNRPVTLLSSIETANNFVTVTRKQKVQDKWTNVEVKQPRAIQNYNHYVNGVDRSDQLMSKNNSLLKCRRWWKVLFSHVIDIAVVNSFILFQIHRAANPDNDDLKRPKKFSVAEYREELARQLAELEDYGTPPVYRPAEQQKGEYETEHIPKVSDLKRNCKVCYAATGVELKVKTYCDAPQCQVYLHLTNKLNCFQVWHSNKHKH